jgi:hypothetical protein
LKRALTLLLLAGLSVLCGAREPYERDAPEVSVVNFDWKYAGYVRAETVKQNETVPVTDASTTYKISRRNIYVFRYTAKATLKNTGARAIKSVSWDYVFRDPGNGKELKRYSLQSRQQILPGETQTLTRDVGIDPKDNTRHITTGKQNVEITKIEYADGSAWRQKQ